MKKLILLVLALSITSCNTLSNCKEQEEIIESLLETTKSYNSMVHECMDELKICHNLE